MEDILAVYSRPPDPRWPLICFDESGKSLHAHVREPQPAAPGQPAREDTTYAREGYANLFLACAPHEGWRWVQPTDRRTAVDCAHAVRAVLDGPCADADGIVLVTDNLNTHTPAAFYQAFPAPEARRLLERIEWHYTPTHGSWLNMAELELSALARQCLTRRIPDRATLAREVAAWVEDRNRAQVRIDWRFGIEDARLTLAHCYPVPEEDLQQDISAMSEHSA
jgi:DDE superfamily endonuclease